MKISRIFRFSVFATRLATWQTRYPLRVLGFALLVLVLSLPFAARLRMNAAFAALMPETSRSVQDLGVIADRVGLSSTLTIAVSGSERKHVLDFARRLGERLEQANLEQVNRVDYQVADFVRFVETNKLLYMGLPGLRKLNEDLRLRLEAERRNRDPFDLALDDEVEAPSWEELERFGKETLKKEASAMPRYEEGLFAHPEQNVAILFVRTNVKHGDVERAEQLFEGVERARAEVAWGVSGEVSIDFGGDLMDATHETKALTRQMLFATVMTIALVAGAILFFFRSMRPIPLLVGFLISPLAATAAFAALTVEYLNTSTAFLMSIVIGNGVNPGVMWLSRYFEERRGDLAIEEAVTAAHLGCGRATFVASGAAALAYASLIITDFRGFRDFGLIGGVGMVLCWASAIAFLPALTVLSERLQPIRPVASRRGGHNPYGDLFRKVALARPQWTLAFAFLMTCATGLATAHFFASDPFEYNFRKLTSVRAPGDRIAWVNARQSEVAPETQVGNALLVLAPEEKALPEVERQLQQVAATQGRVLGKVQSLQSLLPQEQKEKVRIVNALRADLAPLASRLDDQDRSRLDAFLPKQDLHELTTADLPNDVARTFRERDGSSGRILYVEHHASRNRWDGAYWIEWVKAVRSVRLSSGQVAVAGNPVVFADMLATIRQDAPRAMLVSFATTVVLIACCLRRLRNQLVTIVALLLGILWMIGGMAALGLKLHFLNLLAFPIALGNGVDYAVNVVQRFETESSLGKSAAQAAAVSISETGGAVVLCSLTTIFGYLSIHVSQNQALRSFAMAMAVAEWTCLLVAVVVVPAWLSLTRRPEPVQFITHRQPVD